MKNILCWFRKWVGASAVVGLLLLFPPHGAASKEIEIHVDASQGRLPISPYLYGKNSPFLYAEGQDQLEKEADLAREAGLKLARESGGNNSTKYNWKNDLASHPDWYNNVFAQKWGERARAIQDHFPETDGLFGLQVLGWVAKSDQYNVDPDKVDPEHKRTKENLCGNGDPNLYLEPWTAKDTAGILDHWFGKDGLGLDPKRFGLWHLDNEPECWSLTHKDVSPTPMTPEECVAKYVAVAKEAKTRYPDIKLMAPGFTNEWFWWSWSDGKLVDGMPWMEYFVKRMAEESKAFGRNLIDIVDFHTYMAPPMDGNIQATDEDVLQEHRIYYDPAFEFHLINGGRRANGGWDNKVEMVFARMETWLDKYFGPGHGIGIGTTESEPKTNKEMVKALWYASHLGTFADHGVRVFTPWTWSTSMWEVLHLFSLHAQSIRVQSASSDEPAVSCYASINEAGDRMTLVLVNRDAKETAETAVSLSGFRPKEGDAQILTLSDLPDGEQTFFSREKNALKADKVKAGSGGFTAQLAPWSITAVELSGRAADHDEEVKPHAH